MNETSEEVIPINPNSRDLLYYERSNSLADVEGKIKSEALKDLAQKSLNAVITLIARGFVPEESQADSLFFAIESLENKFLDETDLPPTLISGKSSQENQQFLADFKTQMQDDDVRGKFLESAKENLAMFQNEMQQHVADYRTKILETLHSFNSGLDIASFDNRVSFMTSEEIDVYLEKTGLSSVYEAGVKAKVWSNCW